MYDDDVPVTVSSETLEEISFQVVAVCLMLGVRDRPNFSNLDVLDSSYGLGPHVDG
ncbi:hypothetical protein WA026_021652, partial [Henosepilachna vigintioctopunctata]